MLVDGVRRRRHRFWWRDKGTGWDEDGAGAVNRDSRQGGGGDCSIFVLACQRTTTDGVFLSLSISDWWGLPGKPQVGEQAGVGGGWGTDGSERPQIRGGSYGDRWDAQATRFETTCPRPACRLGTILLANSAAVPSSQRSAQLRGKQQQGEKKKKKEMGCGRPDPRRLYRVRATKTQHSTAERACSTRGAAGDAGGAPLCLLSGGERAWKTDRIPWFTAVLGTALESGEGLRNKLVRLCCEVTLSGGAGDPSPPCLRSLGSAVERGVTGGALSSRVLSLCGSLFLSFSATRCIYSRIWRRIVTQNEEHRKSRLLE